MEAQDDERASPELESNCIISSYLRFPAEKQGILADVSPCDEITKDNLLGTKLNNTARTALLLIKENKSRPPSISQSLPLLFDQPVLQEAWSIQLRSHSQSNETDHRITGILAEKDLWRSSSSTSHLEWGFCQHRIRSAVGLSRPEYKTSKDEDTTSSLVSLFQGCSTLLVKKFSDIQTGTSKVQFDAISRYYIICCY
ncbi:hypothetical protein BTVI_71852 [Pitangus sulphuratus]|nr:hypothetical protein BTVI_71852 [Pitangus sulphuratus]